MEKGCKKGQATVAYGTARKIRATTAILWENSPMSGSDIAFSSGGLKGRFVATLCPSEGRWFQRWNLGTRVRMADVVTQDQAFSIEIVLAVIQLYEGRF